MSLERFNSVGKLFRQKDGNTAPSYITLSVLWQIGHFLFHGRSRGGINVSESFDALGLTVCNLLLLNSFTGATWIDLVPIGIQQVVSAIACLLYTSDAADE